MLTFTWYDPAGSPWAWNIGDTGAAEGVGVLQGVRGLEMPPFDWVSDPVPLQPGARSRNLKTLFREVDLPLHVRSTSPPGLRAQLRALRRALDPSRGMGVLRVGAEDGVTRDLACRFVGPWIGTDDPSTSGVVWVDLLTTFRALDPYFYAPAPLLTTFSTGGTIGTFLSTSAGDNFLPLSLSTSNVLSEVPVTNQGDVPAWPNWTVTGPCTSVTMRNATPNPPPALEIDTTLGVGQQLVVRTGPGDKTVLGPGGVNLFGAINATSREFWSLPLGTSRIRVEVNGASLATTVVMSYTPTYLGI